MWVNNYTCRTVIGNHPQPHTFILPKEIGMRKDAIPTPECQLLITKGKAEQVTIQQPYQK